MRSIPSIVLFALLGLGTNSHGQTICNNPANVFNNRCEGFEQLNVRASFYLSSFKAYQRFNYQENDKLYVHFFQPTAGTSDVMAKLIREASTHYAMHANTTEWKQGWQRFGPWPVDDFLAPNGIPGGNIGLFIRTEAGVILPGYISNNEETVAPFSKYRVHFYTPTDIKTLEYQVIDESTSKVVVDENEEDFVADESFSLKFEMPASAKAGQYTLRLTMIRGNDRRLIKNYTFYHQP